MVRKRKPTKHKPPPPLKDCTPQGTLLGETVNEELLNKWPKINNSVPPIFLHKPAEFSDHVLKLLHLGIHFYKPILCTYNTKIKLASFEDHRQMSKYFEKLRVPFHSYGMPNNRKIKVVIKGLPHGIDLMNMLQELRDVSIPVVRVHKMQTKGKDRPALYLIVVPQSQEGFRMFKVKKIVGHDVQLEPPKERPEQCHRCQQWGHAQRYCHGEIKCVKCAGKHFSKKCTLDKGCPPKCANCGLSHTANYQKCYMSPLAPGHKEAWNRKLTMLTVRQLHLNMADPQQRRLSELVSYENVTELYRSPNPYNLAILDDIDSDDSIDMFPF